MKRNTILLIAASLVVGAVAGFLWARHEFKKYEFAQEVEVAAQAGMNAILLAQLRLNETTNSISTLENQIYQSMQAMVIWDQALPPAPVIRARRNDWLTPVKIYYQSYPPQGRDAPQILSFLAQIPGRGTNRSSASALDRLDDLRRAGLPPATNAATK
jgi:type II secretory pathway pseudopilin PulG